MKLRFGLIFLLSAAVILSGAFLPRLAGSWLDSHESGLVNYAQITDIHLSFADAEGKLNMRQKLPLLARYDSSTEIPVSLAKKTKAQVQTIAEQFVSTCKKEGLLSQDLNAVYEWAETQAFLAYWDDTETWSNTFWTVFVTFDIDCTLQLIIDDETGAVCSLIFLDNRYYDMDTGLSYSWYDHMGIQTEADIQSALETLCSVYLNNLGDDFSNYDVISLVFDAWDNSYPYEEGEVLSTQFNWGDLVFGETTVNFHIDPSGFRVTLY